MAPPPCPAEPPPAEPLPRWSRETLREALRGQVLLAPLTTGGNLPFRALCVEQGARITCSEMVLVRRLLDPRCREAVLLRRHPREPVFGVQLASRRAEEVAEGARAAEAAGADFVDLNLGCPIDSAVRHGLGAALLEKPARIGRLVEAMRQAVSVPVFVKIRTGYREGRENAVEVARIAEAGGADAITVHGRTREQRYRRPAEWERIADVAARVAIPVIGNGDILSGPGARERLRSTGVAAVMVGRGALIKPWLWRELGEPEERPVGAAERLGLMRRWVELALDHWGRDGHGFLRVRRFLEFHVDFWRRYVPPGAAGDGEAPAIQRRQHPAPRDDQEALLRAEGPDGIARVCELVLAPFDPPEPALRSSRKPLERGAGWG